MKKLCIVLLALLAACSHDPVAVGQDQKLPAEALRSFTASELSAASSANSFGLSLFQRVAADPSPNVMISPLSAWMALGMAMNGAAGSTLPAMQAALGFTGGDEAAINEAYRGLMAQLNARSKTTEFHLANSLWYRQGFDVQQAFLDAARTKFAARVSSLDFNSPDAPKTISAWASDQTGGRIKDLVPQIDPNDVMFLINAVYFKAPWQQAFDARYTRPASFMRTDGSTMSVQMMSNDGTYGTLDNGEVNAVELLYKDTTFSMVLVAPGPGLGVRSGGGGGADQLAQLVAGLTPAKFNGWLSAMSRGRMIVQMPKFKFDYDVTMNDALRALGMGVAFNPLQANFDRIPLQARDDLFISKVRQKAFIDVNEAGSEAGAATSVGISVTSLPPTIRFDQPFLMVKRERSSGTILFVARVGDPTAAAGA